MDSELPPFWLVWTPSGVAPIVKHPSVDAAETEAMRLARRQPGQEFYVLAPCSQFKLTDVEIRRFSTDAIPF